MSLRKAENATDEVRHQVNVFVFYVLAQNGGSKLGM